ncbi:glycosyltransferase [Phycicoccus sp. Root563]|uniref:glycosyltransferase n=1 Tax=Phycicoccus sp. Root563 TaxID=1736562 RepID=UPI0012FB196B|nr:glycosyltransferase [Phycicoccus sp. Root563]
MTVLVMAYNHQEYLAEALDSILAQDFSEPFEILIGEDCSTDDTLAIAESYARSHPDKVRVISSSTNVGMHANHRRLLVQSRGEYVAYCEGDDYWASPSKLSRQVAQLRSNPVLSGVHSDVDHLVTRDGRPTVFEAFWSTSLPQMGTTTTFDDLIRRNTIQTCSVMLRGEVARAFAGSPLDLAEYSVGDWPLFLHVSAHGPFGFDPSSLAVYRKVEGSATNQGVAAAERRIADQFRLTTDAARLHPAAPDAVEAGKSETLWNLVVLALRSGDHEMLSRWLDRDPPVATFTMRLRCLQLATKAPPLFRLTGLYFRSVEVVSMRRRYRDVPT